MNLFWYIVSLSKPVALELSNLIGVGSYRWLRYLKVYHNSRAIWVFIKIQVVSALVAEETMYQRVLHVTRTGTLIGSSILSGLVTR